MRKCLLSDHYFLEPRNSFFALQDYDLTTNVVPVVVTLLDVLLVENVVEDVA